MVHLVHRILSLQLTVVENRTFKVKTLIKPATYFTHEWSSKKKQHVYSIHCEAVYYSKQYCPWNGSLFGNCKVSAQHTVIAVNCRWKQDIQGKDINKTRKLIYRWIKLQKDTISLWAFIVKRVFILNSIAFKTGHSLKWYSQCKEGSHWSVL